MKTLVLAAASLAMMSGAALASSQNGMIAKFNSSARVITLESGKSFTIPRDVALPPVQVGEQVSIQLNDEGDKVTTVLR
ncbi:DUF1344 domain-containing protein [Aminobacter sp. P9b]|uniref:DUF1344 domain-containing protein n=1 Tax=Aminobacter niigataensis TaxID=83265 RepID=A0ABR6KW45_9HYPH|nr:MULTISPECIES: DUF1344 domain-containing protein [Aminobacter]AWC23363.1 hypothetical protein CO731_02833 [Aminobacter sp. MSH1]MBB4648746.1 hypothetical protein [Aminobacter niigataensis]CAI2934023.1 conserved exported protein of unknown function [Aminobacter niigataensis]